MNLKKLFFFLIKNDLLFVEELIVLIGLFLYIFLLFYGNFVYLVFVLNLLMV